MRALFYILLIVIPLFTNGQKIIKGTYLFPQKKSWTTEILSIDKDGQFKYFYNDCQFIKLGKGRIEVIKDSITLRFENISQPAYNISEVKYDKDDSVSVKVNVFYMHDSTPTTNGIICIKELYTGNNFYIDKQAAEFKSIRSKTLDTFEVNQIGSIPVKVPLNPMYSSLKMTIYLSNTLYFDNSTIIKYGIDDQQRIQLHTGDYYYTKISKAKARKIIKKWNRPDLILKI